MLIITLGFFLDSDLQYVKYLEDRRIHILSIEEKLGGSRAESLWLSGGDKNTNFFHKYASFRRSINSIWDLFDDEGNEVFGQKELEKEAVKHFKFLISRSKGGKLSLSAQTSGSLSCSVLY
jgi:hypothetical protein